MCAEVSGQGAGDTCVLCVGMHRPQHTVGVRERPSAVGSLFLPCNVFGSELKALYLVTSAAY